MLGDAPKLPHATMRWLMIILMLLNGGQLVLLQLAINSSAMRDVGTTWLYVAISGGVLLLSVAILIYAFVLGGKRR